MYFMVFSKAIIDFLLSAILGVLCAVPGSPFKRPIVVTTSDGNCGSHKHGRLHLVISDFGLFLKEDD